jgi:hypothetical protein
LRAWLAVAGSVLALCAGAAVGCATGGAADDNTTGGDAGKDATSKDGGTTGDSGNCPTGRTGPSCQDCAGGFHICGTNCEQDHSNVPDAGCSQGCNNTPCSSPQNATAKCTSDGQCDFACNTSYQKSDAGCACSAGTIDCNGTCQQCCTDTDCPGHQTCSGGTCAGCQAGWGDCNGNSGDGCETHLNSTSNCGSCGHSCCGSFCGCGFLGVGGESCNASGSSFSCGC